MIYSCEYFHSYVKNFDSSDLSLPLWLARSSLITEVASPPQIIWVSSTVENRNQLRSDLPKIKLVLAGLWGNSSTTWAWAGRVFTTELLVIKTFQGEISMKRGLPLNLRGDESRRSPMSTSWFWYHVGWTRNSSTFTAWLSDCGSTGWLWLANPA